MGKVIIDLENGMSPLELNTEYKSGDILWFIEDVRIVKAKVLSLSILIKGNISADTYYTVEPFSDNVTHTVGPYDLFAHSKGELLKKLSDSCEDGDED